MPTQKMNYTRVDNIITLLILTYCPDNSSLWNYCPACIPKINEMKSMRVASSARLMQCYTKSVQNRSIDEKVSVNSESS